MPEHVSSSPASPDGPGRRWSWLLPAGTFLAGLALGGVVVGAGAVGDGDGDGADAPAAAPAAAAAGEQDGAGGGGSDADAGLYVRVPDSCVQTAEDATTLVDRVDRVAAAVADLQAEGVRRAVDDVQELRDGLRTTAEQCRDAASQRLQDGAEVDSDATSDAPAS